MIKYKFAEELQYATYYAKQLEDGRALSILQAGEVTNSDEATILSKFFWKMVDAAIEDEESQIELPWAEGGEFWHEKIMNSFSFYLERAGFENEWNEEVDQQ